MDSAVAHATNAITRHRDSDPTLATRYSLLATRISLLPNSSLRTLQEASASGANKCSSVSRGRQRSPLMILTAMSPRTRAEKGGATRVRRRTSVRRAMQMHDTWGGDTWVWEMVHDTE